MVQEYIRLRGARENNLQNISLDIPNEKSLFLLVYLVPEIFYCI